LIETDEELVSAFRGGDSSAFDALVQRWERKIQGAVYRIMGPGEDARDLTQETFLRAYRGLSTFKSEARFSSWLYQIALNLCRDRLRQKRGRTLVSLEDLDPHQAARIQTKGPSAHEEYQGLTFQEIANVLRVPVSTVKTRLYRGLVQMREHLERRGVHNGASAPAS
jgi:RNA polymerase sigma-70 factor (ECF subfamily)